MRKLAETILVAAVPAIVMAATAAHASAQEPNFGRAIVATEADLFVGQPVNWYGPGVVYTYRRDASGEWQEASRLVASDSSRKDDFGRSLAVDGNTLIVGAPRKRDGSGVAYVFERASDAAAWRQVAIIEPPAEGDHSEYASSLSLSGGDLLIGAPAVDSTGVVYHFSRAGGTWSLHNVIRPASPVGVAGFGRTLSQQGDWLLVGAPAADSGTGAVFISRRTADGGWGEPRAVSVPRGVAGARAGVGAAVLLDGDRAYVGAPG
ncbi:MAG TPA: FG-GAP repeat protein, partial [Longimicrobiales bacterium]|nr:FG-GAP repeat protein [Longimicrobiales bacterium]